MSEQRDNSEVAICNQALGLVGSSGIASLDQTHSVAAQTSKLYYATVRDRLQRVYRWNFNTVRAALAVRDTAPAYKFSYAYEKPAGCLRVLALEGGIGEDWALEGDAIVTNRAPPLNGKWLVRVEDVAQFDPCFYELLYHELAIAMAPKLARDRGIPNYARTRLKELQNQARPADAKEAEETAEGFVSEFISVRALP